MKIKSDFVTNSSSTSYLVYIPDNFKIEKFRDMILEHFDEDLKEALDCFEPNDDGDLTIDEIIEKLFKEFNDLISSGVSYQYENNFYYIMNDLLDKLDLVLDTEENSSSDNGVITNINSKILKNKIKTIKDGGWGIKFGGWGHESKD